MFRATTSFVSALSGCVANDCQLNAPVFPSPSKIPYGGFSPVRLQTERCIPRPSRFRAYTRPLPMSRAPVARFRAIQRGTLTRPSRPEALGSPAGYAVPPAHRLLWPHLRLSPPPARLFASSDRLTPSHLTRGMRGSPIYSSFLFQRAVSRTPADRKGSYDYSSPRSLQAFPIFALGRHPHRPHRRFSGGQCHEAAEFTLCYGPMDCLPFTDKDLYYRAFTS